MCDSVLEISGTSVKKNFFGGIVVPSNINVKRYRSVRVANSCLMLHVDIE